MAKIVYKDIKPTTLFKDATAGDIVRCTLSDKVNFDYRVIIMIIDLEQIKNTIETETFIQQKDWEMDNLIGGINLITGELMLFSKEKECEIYKNCIIIDDSAF